MKTAEELAALIIQRANDGYHHDSKNYPPYALAAWDDRVRWSAYVQRVAAEVLAEELPK